MTKAKITKLLLAGALLTGMGGVLLAHSPDPDWGHGWGHGWMQSWGDGWGRRHGPDWDTEANIDGRLTRIEGRMAFLKTELKITDKQLSAWDDFTEAVKDNTKVHNALMKSRREEMFSGDFYKRPMPERLKWRINHMEARLDQLKELQESIVKLYAELDKDQKEAADDLALPLIGMGCGRRQGCGRRGFRF